MLHQMTTTTLNPAEIHAIGVSEVARIEGEMRQILDANGFAGRSNAEAIKALNEDPQFQYPNDDAGRAAALAEYKRLIDEALERSKQLFATLPKAPMEVQRVPSLKKPRDPARTTRDRRWMAPGRASSSRTSAT
jgi:uncharacterized protein (DUF885 family)